MENLSKEIEIKLSDLRLDEILGNIDLRLEDYLSRKLCNSMLLNLNISVYENLQLGEEIDALYWIIE